MKQRKVKLEVTITVFEYYPTHEIIDDVETLLEDDYSILEIELISEEDIEVEDQNT